MEDDIEEAQDEDEDSQEEEKQDMDDDADDDEYETVSNAFAILGSIYSEVKQTRRRCRRLASRNVQNNGRVIKTLKSPSSSLSFYFGPFGNVKTTLLANGILAVL